MQTRKSIPRQVHKVHKSMYKLLLWFTLFSVLRYKLKFFWYKVLGYTKKTFRMLTAT